MRANGRATGPVLTSRFSVVLNHSALLPFSQAAAALSKHPTAVSSGEEARKLPGVGDKIGKKIDELLQTGKLKKLENIRNDDTSTALKVFCALRVLERFVWLVSMRSVSSCFLMRPCISF